MKKIIIMIISVVLAVCCACSKNADSPIDDSPISELTDATSQTGAPLEDDDTIYITTDDEHIVAPLINPPLGPYTEEGGSIYDYASIINVNGIYYTGYEMPQTEDELLLVLEGASLVGEPVVIGWGEGFIPESHLESTNIYPEGTLIYQNGNKVIAVFPNAVSSWGKYTYYGHLLKQCDSDYLEAYNLN